MDPESRAGSRAEPEPRSAGSIVADLIQDMNTASQPAAAAADGAADEEPLPRDASEEEPAAPNPVEEDPAPVDSAEVDSAEEDSAEESVAEQVADEPEVLVELDVDPGAIEAILLVVDEPLTAITLATVLDRPAPAVAEALRGLAMAYDAEQRGFDLREVAGGWRLYTREQYAEVVEKFVLDGQQAKLTQASLETLAVVAYRQPVSRSRVSAIRGVNCDGVMRTLIARGLIEETGVEGESGATLYSTTSYFLERLGLNSLDELPDLAPYLPEMDEIEDAIHAESALPQPPGDHDADDVPPGDEPQLPHEEPDEQ